MAAAVTPTADQTSELLQSLSLDSQAKTMELPEPTKKASVDSSNATNGQIQPADRSLTPLIPDYMDPALCYLPNGYPYYYGGYEGTGNEWDGYPRYVNPDGVEMSGVYGDNGSLVYQHGYGYNPYAPYSPATSPVPTVGHDGQYYGAQHYQYPTPYFQPFTGGPYTTPASLAKGEIPISAAADQAPLTVDSANANSNGNENGGGMKGNLGSAPLRPAYHNSSFNSNGSYGRGTMPGGVASGYQDPRFAFDGLPSPIPWLDTTYSDGHSRPVNNNSFTPSSRSGMPSSRNQNTYQMGLPHSRPMSGTNSNYTNNGYMNRMYSNNFYSQYGNTYGSGLVYGSSGYQSRTNNRGWMSADNKFKPRGRGSGYYGFDNENMDGLNELNRGPRAKGSKNQKGFVPAALAIKGQQIPLTASNDNEKENACLVPDREQYNRPDFPETYADAKFFVIKSYSEDDVHKSVKYNVWSSTPNGNKKLDEAYREAQQKSEGCPIFLFFSVNTSGQFVGMAEMVGPVDFNKKVEYWQQDKWIGCFPLKWHIVKDVPNSLLKHITLENNENKPVTNSRDTQEIKLEQGLQVIKIFKDHTSKQCILDDFEFYEDRQKRIQDKKAKQQLFQKQACEGKAIEEKKKENTNGELKLQKPAEVSGEAIKKETPSAQSNGDIKPAESGSVTISGDLASSVKQSTPSESKTVATHGS